MKTGRKAAKDLFDCRGLYIPMKSDSWGISSIEGYGYSIWAGVAAWCAQHFWWHYEYSQDQEFLEKRAYPFIKQVAIFYQDFLVKDDNGVFQITPSQSPENSFKEAGDIAVASCISSAMDIQLVQDCLSHAIQASERLDVDCESRKIWRDILDNLEPMKIDSLGRLMEWDQEFTEREPGHRHISHLFGLYPGEQIDPERTPELYEGAIKSLRYRLENLGGTQVGVGHGLPVVSRELVVGMIHCVISRI